MTTEATNTAGSRAEAAVLAVLPRNVRAHAVIEHDGTRMRVNGSPLDVKWLMDGRLGEVRHLLGQRHRPDVVVARQFSPGARQALAEAGVGWVDESGAAEIAIGPIVVSRSGTRPPSKNRPRGWTPSALAVAEALLCGTRATTHEVVEATGLSLGSSVNGLRLLTDLGLLEARRARGPDSGRSVRNINPLLAAYATAAVSLASELSLEVGVTWRDPADGIRQVASVWEKAGLRYAVTGGVAAEILAPHLTAVPKLEVYVAGDSVLAMEVAADVAGLRPIEGGRLLLRPFPTVAVRRLAECIDGIVVAPWPRVYVDLLHAGVRGEDAAEHLKETKRG